MMKTLLSGACCALVLLVSLAVGLAEMPVLLGLARDIGLAGPVAAFCCGVLGGALGGSVAVGVLALLAISEREGD